MITKYIKGDITETELNFIAHGVNCQNVMGSGVAKALYKKFPEVKKEYHEFIDLMLKYAVIPHKYLLGEVNMVQSGDKVICNCFTQEHFGYDKNIRYVNYYALAQCFDTIKRNLPEGSVLAIPKIGCGLAGGDWEIS